MENAIENIIVYCDEVFDTYPNYSKYLSLNNVISDYLLAIYYSDNIPKNLEYKTYFTNHDSISLARQIISSISNRLVVKLDKYIHENRIRFQNNDFSYTTNKTGNIESVIRTSNTVLEAINLVHEFMHCIHLEKLSKLDNQEYYYYTEIMGLIGDIYSTLYLLKNNLYKSDAQAYLSDIIKNMAQAADSVLTFGTILHIYKAKNGLSKQKISDYIRENNISPEFLNVVDKYTDIERFLYHDDARYIFAFPIAFKISEDLINNNSISKYIDEFNKLPHVKTDLLLHNLNLDTHFNDSEQLNVAMNNIYNSIVKSFEETKVKKIGEK